VSKGQAYGMLIADVARQPPLVSAIWSLTSAHLGRGDGSLA
jgi:endo-1,4-beta-D-glucanase Y